MLCGCPPCTGRGMSSAYAYLRCFNRIYKKNALFSTRTCVLGKGSQSLTSHPYASRPKCDGSERMGQICHSSGLWNYHNAHQNKNKHDSSFKFPYFLMFIPVAVKRLFGYEDDKEMDPKEALILSIKRSILLAQKGEKDKAEQMLHVALKMAQDQRSEEGVTYVYDVMANLAFDCDEFKKAETLFVFLLQRLLASGMEESDNKFIHINLKLAKVYQYSKSPDKCDIGYKYCLNALEKKLQTNREDEDTVMLWCLALDWYGRFLLEQDQNKSALSYLTRAHDTLLQFGGETHPQLILLLNDLGIAHSMLDNETVAVECFEKALKLGKELDDPLVPNIMVNMGLLYLRKLNLEAAKTWCMQGKDAALMREDLASEAEASDCLTAIKKATKMSKS